MIIWPLIIIYNESNVDPHVRNPVNKQMLRIQVVEQITRREQHKCLTTFWSGRVVTATRTNTCK